MKPLVYYCRWQRASLRLRGRDSTAVWGQLVYQAEDGKEESQEFRYLLDSAELILYDDEAEHHHRLDEKGVPLPQEG